MEICGWDVRGSKYRAPAWARYVSLQPIYSALNRSSETSRPPDERDAILVLHGRWVLVPSMTARRRINRSYGTSKESGFESVI